MYIPTTSVKLLCIQGTIHQLSVHQQDLPSMSVNFPCGRRNFHKLSVHLWDLSSPFPISVGPSVNLCQLSVRPWDLPSTSVNFLCIRGTIHQSFVCQRNIVSSSVNILGGRVTFRLLPSTFHVSVHPSFLLAFHVATGLLSTFFASAGCSVYLGQLSVHQRGLPATSINF